MPIIEQTSAALITWSFIGYLLGSIPFGLIIARVMGLGNLRTIGSGNIGATNVLRTGNKGAAILTLLLDGGKGAIAVILARIFAGDDCAQLAAFAAFLGHCFPIWLRFKGGKGVATFLGILLALAWPIGLAACATWLVGAFTTRISSFAALLAAASSTFWMLGLGKPDLFFLGIALTLFVFWTHRANIARLRNGTEPKIGQK